VLAGMKIGTFTVDQSLALSASIWWTVGLRASVEAGNRAFIQGIR
jgi:hypothetical protein